MLCCVVLLLLDAEAVGEEWTSACAIDEEERMSTPKEQLLVVAGDSWC